MLQIACISLSRTLASLVLASLFGAAIVGSTAAALASEADNFPNRAVRLIVPYAAGATTDTLARTVGLKLEAKWKQSVVVENLPGGGGMNGTAVASRTPGDGYTLVIVTASHVILPAVMARPPFDPIKSFAPVTMMVKSPGLLLSSKASGISNFSDILKRGKEEQLSYGSSGVGSKHHVTMVELSRLANIKSQHISYRGSAQAMNDIIGGHLQLQMGAFSFGHEFVRKGQVNGIAIVAEKRHPMLPDVPTLTELGYPLASGEWWALLASAGTPPAIVDKIAKDVAEALLAPEVKARMPADELVSSTPQELLEFLKAEGELWGGTAKRTGMKID
jgi:tripartite-type tricarboxylate transporter receptor subunit TctC